MYCFVTDETNVQPNRDSRFFIYGGLVFSSEQMKQVNSEVAGIRQRYDFKPHDKLKFDTRSRPEQVSVDDYTAAKNAVIQACNSAGVKFIAYLIHHSIVDPEYKEDYALNSVLVAFNQKFLTEHNDHGIVIIDRMPDSSGAYNMLKQKFQDGLTLKGTGSKLKLDRVVMYATTCDGASHLSSAVDIVLGGFRWVVNAQGRPTPGTTERQIFTNVAQMMYAKKVGDTLYARDYGLILRPETVRVQAYKAEYDNLVRYMVDLFES